MKAENNLNESQSYFDSHLESKYHQHNTAGDYLNKLGVQEYNLEGYARNLNNLALEDNPEAILDISCLRNTKDQKVSLNDAEHFDIEKELSERFNLDSVSKDIVLPQLPHSREKEREECEKRRKIAENVLRKSREECIRCEEEAQRVRESVLKLDASNLPSKNLTKSIQSLNAIGNGTTNQTNFKRHGSSTSLPPSLFSSSSPLKKHTNISRSMRTMPQMISTSSGKNVLEYVSTDPSDSRGETLIKSNSKITDPIINAIETGQIQKLLDIINSSKNGRIIDKRYENGNTILHCATTVGNVHIVKLLMERFPDLMRVENNEKLTPLGSCIKAGQVDCLDSLLSSQNIPSYFLPGDPVRRSFVHLAAKYGQDGCLRLLLQRLEREKVNVDELKDINGNSLAHVAAKYGHLTCLQTLVEFGCNVTSTNQSGHTPLYLSDFNNQRQCTAYLGLVHTCNEIVTKLANVSSLYSECRQENQQMEEFTEQLLNISSRNITESREAANDYSLATNLIEKYMQLTNDLLSILRERGRCERSTMDHFHKVQTTLYEDALKVPPRTVNFAKFDHLQARVQSFRNDLSYLQKERRIILSSEVSLIRDPNFIFKQHLHSVLEKLTTYRAVHPHSHNFQHSLEEHMDEISRYQPTDRLGVRAVKSPPEVKRDEMKIINFIKTQQSSKLHQEFLSDSSTDPDTEPEYFDRSGSNKRIKEEDSDSDQTISDGINVVANENLAETNDNGKIEDILQEENYLAGYLREPRFGGTGTLSPIEEVSVVSDSVISRSRLDDDEDEGERLKSIEDTKENDDDKSKPWYEVSEDEEELVNGYKHMQTSNGMNSLPTHDHFTLL
ncbi:DgyrCDS3734 [Dimorphilus gyrociliatus]|uniref:DgyrCDS3734 n=1 Tax=Dimorphilus gyrociliatus TaxID=2664684 RepID=A0A7I8VG70_9ANNE|nr:DgyrCDS3734 [Dimorphilus gyrociliatus]